MRFLFPTFLFALFAVAIPVIIHLFSFKLHKTVYFSNVDFLREIKKESKRKSKLKQLLLLAARILTIIFLVFAFSQPYIPVNKDVKKQAGKIVAVYIDNSFSMSALSEQGQLLEVARNKAVEICQAYSAGTKFRLFTNNLEAKHQHNMNREQFVREVAGVRLSPVTVPLSQIYNKFAQHNVTDGNSDKEIFFISDFQRQITDPEAFSKEHVYSYYLKLDANEVANLYIDSCFMEVPAHRPGQEEEIFVRIKNNSNRDYDNLPLKLYLNDSIKSISNFSVAANNEITASLKYNNNTSGFQLGRLEITDYPFTYDNNWYISYYVEPNLKTLAVYSSSKESAEGLKYIEAMFENDDYVMLDKMNINNLQVSKLGSYNAIFLINIEKFSSGLLSVLKDVAASGSSVVLFPSDGNEQVHNNLFVNMFGASAIVGSDTTKQKISGVDFGSSFYKNVFRKREKNAVMPEITGHLRFKNNTRTRETRLLWFQNNDKALSVLDYEKGKVWVFGFALTDKNAAFARDVIFVPTIYNIVLNSLPRQDISFTVGRTTFYDLAKGQGVDVVSDTEIENLKTGEKFIPVKTGTVKGIRLDFKGQITDAGHYLIKNGDKTVAAMAFNFDRRESDLQYVTTNELKEKLKLYEPDNAVVIEDVSSSFSEIFDEINNGKQLWKLFVFLALAAIAFEVAVARWMR